MVSRTWTENEGTLCAGLNWERFQDLDHALVRNTAKEQLLLLDTVEPKKQLLLIQCQC